MKINIKNTEKIQAALENVQKLATARTLGAGQILSVVEHAERKMQSAGIAKSHLVGAVINITGGEISERSYKYKYGTTVATIRREVSGWFMVHCEREEHTPGGNVPNDNIVLPQVLREAYARKAVHNLETLV